MPCAKLRGACRFVNAIRYDGDVSYATVPAVTLAAMALLLSACTPFPLVTRVAKSRPGWSVAAFYRIRRMTIFPLTVFTRTV